MKENGRKLRDKYPSTARKRGTKDLSAMPVKLPYTQRLKTGRWEYRRDVPMALRPYMPSSTSTIRRTLGTTDPRDPALLAAYEKAHAEAERLLSRAKKGADGLFDELDDATIADLVALDRHLQLSADDESRFDGAEDANFKDAALEVGAVAPGATSPWVGQEDDRLFEKRAESLPAYLAALRSAFGRGKADVMKEEAEEIALARGLRVDVASLGFRRLAAVLLVFRIETVESFLHRQEGRVTATPPAPEPRIAHVIPMVAKDTRTLNAAIEAFRAARDASLSQSSRAAYDATFRLLRGIVGEDRPVASLTREDGLKLVDVIRSLPANLGKRRELRGLSIGDAVARAKTLNLPTIAPKTVNATYIANLHTFFRWLVSEQWIERDPVPTGTQMIDPVAPEDKRDPFSDDQFQAIFTSDPWSASSAKEFKHPLHYWGPLIGLFMGLRRGEIAQLRVQDFAVQDGVPTAVVVADAGTDGRRGKTRNARRRLPVHSELVRAGLLDFVEAQRGAGQALWPGEAAGVHGKWGDGLSDWFGRLLAKRGISGRRLGMHSFRHNFEDRLREADLHGTAIGAYMAGRRWKDAVSSGYGAGFSTRRLAEAMEKIAYPGLDLSHLRPSHSSEASEG